MNRLKLYYSLFYLFFAALGFNPSSKRHICRILALSKSLIFWLKFKMSPDLYSTHSFLSSPFHAKLKFITGQTFLPLLCWKCGSQSCCLNLLLNHSRILTPQIPLGQTNVHKDPKRLQREVSSELELKPHCTGSLWGPAVRKRLFCSTTRLISERQGDEEDQPSDFNWRNFLCYKVFPGETSVETAPQILIQQIFCSFNVLLIYITLIQYLCKFPPKWKSKGASADVIVTFIFSLTDYLGAIYLHHILWHIFFKCLCKICLRSLDLLSQEFWFHFQIDLKRRAVTLYYGDLNDSVLYPNPAVFHNNAN